MATSRVKGKEAGSVCLCNFAYDRMSVLRRSVS